MELPILVRRHYKDTVERYDIETLFIIIERYLKLYIYLTVLKLYMTGLWRFVLLHRIAMSLAGHIVLK